jgi:hypothetical protein
MSVFSRTWPTGRTALFGVAVCLAALASPGVARADVIDDVNNTMITIIANTSAAIVDGPPEVANEIQMVDSAMFDAVNAASGNPHPSINYSGGPVAGADASTAALEAAIQVMQNLYCNNPASCGQSNSSTSLYQQYENVKGSAVYSSAVLAQYQSYGANSIGPSTAQMATVGSAIVALQNELATMNAMDDPATVAISKALGDTTASDAISVNDTSGSKTAMTATFLNPNPSPEGDGTPGVYVPPTNRPALQPTWGSVTPQTLTSPALQAVENSIPGPQPLTSSTYANEVLQTECQGASTSLAGAIETACTAAGFTPETTAEATAALFWNDPGGTAQPPGHWLQIADSVAVAQGLDLLQTAQATALASIAMDDAGIATWQVKFNGNMYFNGNAWRPITAIRDCANWSDGSFTTCDVAWNSLIATPPHPDYIAGHPAFSGAAATALADVLGTDNVTFTSTSLAYCNGGSGTTDASGTLTACTINFSCPNGQTATSDSNGAVLTCNGVGISTSGCTSGGGTINNDADSNAISCTYSLAGAGCAAGDTATTDAQGYVTACTTPGGAADSIIGGGCNNSASQQVLNSDGSVNSAYNGSTLICVIAETFDSISQASGGYLGAEYSRVVGGIHTPDAVTDALSVGNAIGTLVADEELPEPPMAPALAGGLLILGALRYRRRSRSEAAQEA